VPPADGLAIASVAFPSPPPPNPVVVPCTHLLIEVLRRPLIPPWLPASEWCTSPCTFTPRQTAISSASVASEVRRCVAIDQPTIMREKASCTNAT
jgi:hypothetical protein